MKHGSLFSGIGGFDLAAEWMGWHNVFHCEINDFGRKVLNHYWPNADSLEDITKTDFTKYAGTVDIISGGFPCQPYSTAGKRLGKDDERHLWPEMLRAIREVKPSYVVGENVLGLVNWNGGLVFEEVQADLEAEGYEVQPYVLPAAGVNAPHRRDRVWFIAYRYDRNGQKVGFQTGRKINMDRDERAGTTPDTISERDSSPAESGEIKGNGSNRIKAEEKGRIGSKWTDGLLGLEGDAADTNDTRLQGSQDKRIIEQIRSQRNKQFARCLSSTWEKFPTQPPICGGDDGLPTKLHGITFSKWRNESIKAYGNAIVPQVVYQIFKAIEEYEITLRTPKLPA